MLPHWSARGLENAAYSKFFATQRNATPPISKTGIRILAIASARRLLRNRISGGKKRRLITSSPVNSMETQLRIRAAVYPLSLSPLFLPPPLPLPQLVNSLDEHRVSNPKPEARYSAHGVFRRWRLSVGL